MSQKILVPIASGSEEMEVVTIIDMLIRAGYQVTTATADSDGELILKGSRGISLLADCKLVDIADKQFDAIVLPGGEKGALSLRNSTIMQEILKQHIYEHKLVAAICAAPALILQHHQLYPDAIMTGHPNFKADIPENNWREKRVTIDTSHKLITSQGPGTALEFAAEIIIYLSGKPYAWQILEPMIPQPTLHYNKMGYHEC